MEGVLLAVAHDAEAAVEDAEVRVQRGADAEVELAVVLVAVEPVAVVGVAVARRGLRDRLRRLVDRVVVELAQHGASPGSCSPAQRTTPRFSANSQEDRRRAERRSPSIEPVPETTSALRTDATPLPTTAVEIVVPVHDEAADLEASVRQLHHYLTDHFPHSWAITIADNASTDGTWAIACRLAGELDHVGARHLDAKGRGRALRAAWSASRATVVAY